MSTPDSMDIHDQVHAFADGELSPEEADAFRLHLGTCEQCQTDLDDILQMQALGGRLAEAEKKEATQPVAPPRRNEKPQRAFQPAWSRRRALAAVALTGSLAAVFAVVALRTDSTDVSGTGTAPSASTPVWWATSATRARVSSRSATSGASRSASARAAAGSRTRTSLTRSGAKRSACFTQWKPSSGTVIARMVQETRPQRRTTLPCAPPVWPSRPPLP